MVKALILRLVQHAPGVSYTSVLSQSSISILLSEQMEILFFTGKVNNIYFLATRATKKYIKYLYINTKYLPRGFAWKT